MALSLAQLLSPKTRATIYADLLAELASRGWVRSWHSGSIGRTLFELVAFGLEELHDVTGQIARGGLLDLAAQLEDPTWLDLLGEGFYRLPRALPQFARIGVRLTAAPGVGPITVAAGEYTLAEVASGRLYRLSTGGTLTVGGTLDLEASAERAGAAYNIGGLVAMMQLQNPPAGVTVALRDVGGATCVISPGTNTESNALYAQRCKLRWASLATADPRDKLRAWSLEADERVTSVSVDDVNPRGPGTINVWLGGPDGPAVAPAVANADTLIQARRALPSNVLVQAAMGAPVVITGTVFARSREASELLAELQDRIRSLQSRISVGEVLYRSQLIEELMAPVGVYNVSLSGPAADVVTAISQIVDLDDSGLGVVVSV
jgi:hypothetical protein